MFLLLLENPENKLQWNTLNLISLFDRGRTKKTQHTRIRYQLCVCTTNCSRLVESFAVVVYSGSLWADRRGRPADHLTVFFYLTLHVCSFLQEDLQQLILMPLPNVAILGQDPLTGTRYQNDPISAMSLCSKKVIILYIRVHISAIWNALRW